MCLGGLRGPLHPALSANHTGALDRLVSAFQPIFELLSTSNLDLDRLWPGVWELWLKFLQSSQPFSSGICLMLTLPISIVLSVLMSGAAFLTVSVTTILFAYLLIGPLLANCFTKKLLGKMPLQWQAQLVDQLSAEMVAPQFAKLPAKLCPKTMALPLYKLAKPLPTHAIFT